MILFGWMLFCQQLSLQYLNSMKKLVIGIPIYNEEALLDELYKRVNAVAESIKEYEVEILFVNDGSADESRNILKKLEEENSRVQVVNFSRNFGLEAALRAIIDSFRGDALVIIDGDLQDPPEMIPDLIAKWEEGIDVVYTIKKSRKESAHKKALFSLFYKIQSVMTDINIPMQSGNFSLLDSKVVETIQGLEEHNQYFPGVRAWVGYKQEGLYYDRDERFAGEPKMSYRRLFNLALNGIFSYTKLPQRLTYFIGVFFLLIGFIIAIYAIIGKITHGREVLGWASTIITIVTVGGFQMIFISLLGEYVVRIFDESKKRPNYILDKEKK